MSWIFSRETSWTRGSSRRRPLLSSTNPPSKEFEYASKVRTTRASAERRYGLRGLDFGGGTGRDFFGFGFMETSSGRREESRRGTHECVRHIGQRGMLPCFFLGMVSTLVSSIRNDFMRRSL